MTLTAAPDTRPAPAESTTPIRPSEAIRLGCLITGPAVGAWFADDGSTCALGAMLIGFGGDETSAWPALYHEFRYGPPLPTPGVVKPMTPGGALIWLNDVERWSRERIADWLAEQGL